MGEYTRIPTRTGDLQPMEAMGKEKMLELDLGGVTRLEGSTVQVYTKYGPISVTVMGDRKASPCVTFHDVGLNHQSCFQGLLVCSASRPLLVKNFCFYHIDAPGCEDGATNVHPDALPLTVHKLMDQVDAVVEHFDLNEILGMGVGAGGYILAMYAAQHPKKMAGLILVSPPCLRPGWWEWTFGSYAVSKLNVVGMVDSVKEHLLARLIHSRGQERNLALSLKHGMASLSSQGVSQYLSAILKRPDLSEDVQNLKCRTLVLCGEESTYSRDCLHINTIIDHTHAAWVEIPECGILATEEKPNELLSPITLFLTALQQTGYGFGWDLT
ncbi:unnamed protein product [Ostreobium quekettii]|uniref:Uncharacterized protein n=1 Tax=Ostreobium quekettii TaxID=121088 RepID=A0A8S1J7N1_9CHLO|nr:unnamed protein product [Ostreobium quekettii]|eukprot:evm.model.scf_544.5 EVM.evm.TU.scf_544.5   scf_544:25521-28527(+)